LDDLNKSVLISPYRRLEEFRNKRIETANRKNSAVVRLSGTG
jgi:hypothetical protein